MTIAYNSRPIPGYPVRKERSVRIHIERLASDSRKNCTFSDLRFEPSIFCFYLKKAG